MLASERRRMTAEADAARDALIRQHTQREKTLSEQLEASQRVRLVLCNVRCFCLLILFCLCLRVCLLCVVVECTCASQYTVHRYVAISSHSSFSPLLQVLVQRERALADARSTHEQRNAALEAALAKLQQQLSSLAERQDQEEAEHEAEVRRCVIWLVHALLRTPDVL